MNKEKYRPEHEVYFLGNVVLFPNNLTNQPLDPWFFRPFFNFVDADKNQQSALEFAEMTMEEYKNKGYIVYKKVHGLFQITQLNIDKAKDDLINYLSKWQQNKLYALSAAKPIDTNRQRELLVSTINRALSNHQEEPRISLTDIHWEPDQLLYKPPFWELVLSYHLLDGAAVITAMDYDRREDGLYEDGAVPYVDLEITSDELKSSIESPEIKSPNSTEPTGNFGKVVTKSPETLDISYRGLKFLYKGGETFALLINSSGILCQFRNGNKRDRTARVFRTLWDGKPKLTNRELAVQSGICSVESWDLNREENVRRLQDTIKSIRKTLAKKCSTLVTLEFGANRYWLKIN